MRYYFLTYVAKGKESDYPDLVLKSPLFGSNIISITGNCFAKMDGPIVLAKIKPELEESGLTNLVFTSFTELDEETYLANTV